MSEKCKVAGCQRIKKACGLCGMHYARLRKHGDAGPVGSLNVNVRKNFFPEYISYSNMKTRCYNKNHKQYKNYGGRGIKVCERWLGVYGFLHFREDMGKRPEGYTLDRIDVNGDYCPENCRWADLATQQKNRKHVVKVRYNGEDVPIYELARKKGFSPNVLYNRVMKYNWSLSKALLTPTRPRRTKK